MCKGPIFLSSTWAQMLSTNLNHMTFKTFGRVDLNAGAILITRNSLRGPRSWCKFVFGVCVGTSGGHTVLQTIS
jgi:hypothetical protein